MKLAEIVILAYVGRNINCLAISAIFIGTRKKINKKPTCFSASPSYCGQFHWAYRGIHGHRRTRPQDCHQASKSSDEPACVNIVHAKVCCALLSFFFGGVEHMLYGQSNNGSRQVVNLLHLDSPTPHSNFRKLRLGNSCQSTSERSYS